MSALFNYKEIASTNVEFNHQMHKNLGYHHSLAVKEHKAAMTKLDKKKTPKTWSAKEHSIYMFHAHMAKHHAEKAKSHFAQAEKTHPSKQSKSK
jgi:hypothetical protein